MQSFEEIRDDLLEYASSLNIEGVALDKLCSLLAYSVYKDQVLQLKSVLEGSFSTSSNLNSRIHHAANYQYSVPRGRCPILSITNLKSIQTKTYSYMDYIMPFNGYYFYLYVDSNVGTQTVEQGELVEDGLQLLCSSYEAKTVTIDADDDLYFIDFLNAENVSSDFLLYEEDAAVSSTVITEDSGLFYYKTKQVDEEGVETYDYKYKYLVVTIPSYGIRVIRHANTSSWGFSYMKLKYIPYNETTPDFTALRSITGFTLVEDSDTSVYTQLEVIPFSSRMTDLDTIYANATASYLQQGSVATPEDLVIALKKYNSQGYYKVYPDTKINYDSTTGSYEILTDSTTATIVYNGTTTESYEDIQTNCVDVFKESFSVTSDLIVVPAKERYTDDEGNEISLRVKAYSSSKVLTNEDLSNICNSYISKIGQTIDHSLLEADIIKLGFDYVKVYNDDETETSFVITCEKYEYPDIAGRVEVYQ